MTHLTPFVYVDRLVPNIYVFVALCYYVLILHRGAEEINAKNGRLLRLGVFIFHAIAYLFLFAYESLAIIVKYQEGYLDSCLVLHETNGTFIKLSASNNECQGIVPKPGRYYSLEHQALLPTIDLMLNLSCTFRNSGIFLFLAWFNGAVKGIFPQPIVRRWEVRAFMFYSIFSLAWYMILPMLFEEQLVKTIAPQILWSLELYVASAFLILTNRRIRHLSKEVISQTALATLKYVLWMNFLFVFVIMHAATSLLLINVDMVTGLHCISSSPFLSDITAKVLNTFVTLEPAVVLLIVYRPHSLGLFGYEPVRSRRHKWVTRDEREPILYVNTDQILAQEGREPEEEVEQGGSLQCGQPASETSNPTFGSLSTIQEPDTIILSSSRSSNEELVVHLS